MKFEIGPFQVDEDSPDCPHCGSEPTVHVQCEEEVVCLECEKVVPPEQ